MNHQQAVRESSPWESSPRMYHFLCDVPGRKKLQFCARIPGQSWPTLTIRKLRWT